LFFFLSANNNARGRRNPKRSISSKIIQCWEGGWSSARRRHTHAYTCIREERKGRVCCIHCVRTWYVVCGICIWNRLQRAKEIFLVCCSTLHHLSGKGVGRRFYRSGCARLLGASPVPLSSSFLVLLVAYLHLHTHIHTYIYIYGCVLCCWFCTYPCAHTLDSCSLPWKLL
jgi:hypothetical protein